jgi:hypothetical protein
LLGWRAAESSKSRPTAELGLGVEERERALEALAGGLARLIPSDDIGKPLFGEEHPYVSKNVEGESGPVWVAIPIPRDLAVLHNTIQEAKVSLVDELIDRHNRLSSEERNALKVAYMTGKPWLVEGLLVMQLESNFEYAPDSNLLRRRTRR